MRPPVEKLVLEHMDLVEECAKRVARFLPACVELDELISIGYLALCQRALLFQPRRGKTFAAFARKRVYGAMVDAYRGENYPGLFESVPDHWMGVDVELPIEATRVPDSLRDPAPPADERLIREREELHLVRVMTEARERLTPEEKRAMQRHLDGMPVREVGRRERRNQHTKSRSGAWASYTIHEAKAKLRRHLEDDKLKAA